MTPRKTQLLGDHIYCIHGLFSADDCAELLRLADRTGFTAAPISTGLGFRMIPEVRNNTRAMFDDPALAGQLWDRLAGQVAPRVGDYRVVGLNERLRIYRYAPGQYFRWHRDGAFLRDVNEQSLLTLMIYLNDDFEGGSTDFDGGEIRVRPERGMVLIFDHPVMHQGAPVTRGVKYVLRTDVMYRWAA